MNTSTYVNFDRSASTKFLRYLFQKNFESSSLEIIFANAYFGNSIVAILSGITAQLVANTFGYV